MNGRYDMAIDLVSAVKEATSGKGVCDILFFPPALYLKSLSYEIPFMSRYGLGGQNLSDKDDGAYTGEISGEMLKDVDCSYVLIGHSERRQLYGEDNALIQKKVRKAIGCGLRPLLCVGESLEQYEAEETLSHISKQVQSALEGMTADEASMCIIAYEPIWAIGTGKTSSPENAESVHSAIRSIINDLYSDAPSVAENISILYGGSVKPANAAELLAQPNIDGALVGGASLKAEDFIAIINATEE